MKPHKCILDDCEEFNIFVGGGETILTCCECEKKTMCKISNNISRWGWKMIPSHVQTASGCTKVQVLPLSQYINYRVRHRGWKYLFERTSAGYPRIFSLGYFSHDMNEIVVAKVGNCQMRYLHGKGHADGLRHVWIKGDVMHPFEWLRGYKRHVCTNVYVCDHKHKLSNDCYDDRIGKWCTYMQIDTV